MYLNLNVWRQHIVAVGRPFFFLLPVGSSEASRAIGLTNQNVMADAALPHLYVRNCSLQSGCLKECAEPKKFCRCNDSALLLPEDVCATIRDVRLLGRRHRTSYEAHVGDAHACARALLCEPVVRKTYESNTSGCSSSNWKGVGHMCRAAVSANWREAHLLHALQCEFGRASVGFHGVCAHRDGSGVPSILVEKLRPVANLAEWKLLTTGARGRKMLLEYSKRMSSFQLGPLENLDLSFSNFGLDARGHVHALDLGYVRMHLPSPARMMRHARAQVFLKSEACFSGSSAGMLVVPNRYPAFMNHTGYRAFANRSECH